MKSSSFKSPAAVPKKVVPSASVPSSLSSSAAGGRAAVRVVKPSPTSSSSQPAASLDSSCTSHRSMTRVGTKPVVGSQVVAPASVSHSFRSARLPLSPPPPAALVTEAELAETREQVHELQTSYEAERDRRPKLLDMLLRSMVTNEEQIKHDLATRDAWIASNRVRIRECEERLVDLRQQRDVEALRASELREMEEAVLREVKEVESHIACCLAEKEQRLREIAEAQIAIDAARTQIADLTLQLERSRRRKQEQMASLETVKQDVQREQQKERDLQEKLARRKHIIAEVQRKVDRLRKPRSLVASRR